MQKYVKASSITVTTLLAWSRVFVGLNCLAATRWYHQHIESHYFIVNIHTKKDRFAVPSVLLKFSQTSPFAGADVFLLPARRQGAVRQQPRRKAQNSTAPLPAAATRQ